MDLGDRLTVTPTQDETQREIALTLRLDGLVDGPFRLRIAANVLRRSAAKRGGVETVTRDEAVRFRFPVSNEEAFAGFVKRTREHIEQILFAPLTPKAVDRALGITTRERLRWYKDGRLPTRGRALAGRGKHQIQIPLFAFEDVARLAAEPQIIEGWRSDDRRKHGQRLESDHG